MPLDPNSLKTIEEAEQRRRKSTPRDDFDDDAEIETDDNGDRHVRLGNAKARPKTIADIDVDKVYARFNRRAPANDDADGFVDDGED